MLEEEEKEEEGVEDDGNEDEEDEETGGEDEDQNCCILIEDEDEEDEGMDELSVILTKEEGVEEKEKRPVSVGFNFKLLSEEGFLLLTKFVS